MLYTKYYQKDTSDTEWQIAHLFEHLLIRGFYSMLEDKHIQSDFISWTNGDTFERVLFIDALFYTEELANEFDAYATNLPMFSEEDIFYALATLQAEDKIIISVNDMPALQNEVNKLRKRKWNTPMMSFTPESVPKPAILTEKRSAKDFRDIVVVTKSENLTPEEQRLLLRTRILLIDITNNTLAPISGLYQGGHSDIIRRDEHMAFMSGYTITKGTTIKEIRNTLTDAFSPEVFDLEKVLKSHFDVFSNEPLWQNAPIDYFRATGIITTNQEVASLATVDRIRSIISKTSYEVWPMTADHKSYLH